MLSEATAFVIGGTLVLAAVWLPLLTRRTVLSLPIIAVGIGLLGGWWIGADQLVSHYQKPAETLATVVLLVAILGSGLKIDRPFAWRSWSSTWRLLIGAMPLSVLGIAACAVWLLGFSIGEAVLIAGILAPTDPVLASSVQAGPPGQGEDGEVRFALTSEAGLNDGLALPFVLLGILLLAAPDAPLPNLANWFAVDVLWSTLAGAAVGLAFGWALVRLNQILPQRLRVSETGDGLFSLAISFMAYGLAELTHCNGFVAVFVTALALRNFGRNLEYFQQLHDFAEQIERLAMVLLLVLFGAALAAGLLSDLHWDDGAFAILVLFAVRPAATLISYAGSKHPMPVRLATGLLGVRGIGSFYYVTYVINHAHPDRGDEMWSIVGLIVLMSILVYGVSADPVMGYLDRLRERAAR